MRRLVLIALLIGCAADEDAARRALTGSGLTDIKLGDYPFFECGDEKFNSKFTAKNARGQRVAGAVCCGWLKGCTVRFQ